nr:hypothetical protein [Paraburkholderia ribeironis]
MWTPPGLQAGFAHRLQVKAARLCPARWCRPFGLLAHMESADDAQRALQFEFTNGIAKRRIVSITRISRHNPVRGTALIRNNRVRHEPMKPRIGDTATE